MAIALDATTEPNSATGTSFTWEHTCTGENRFLACMPYHGTTGNDVVTGVTYAGASMTRAGTAPLPDNLQRVYLYYKAAPASGANNIVISASSSVGWRPLGKSYTGCHQSAPLDGADSGNATSVTTWSQSLTPNVPNCWVVSGLYGGGGGVNPGAGANTAMDTHQQDVSVAWFNSTLNPVSGLTTLNYTLTSSSNMAAVIISIAPAAEVGIPGFFRSRRYKTLKLK